jgi:hypothetical protein
MLFGWLITRFIGCLGGCWLVGCLYDLLNASLADALNSWWAGYKAKKQNGLIGLLIG